MESESALAKCHDELELEANRNNLAQITELSKKIGRLKQEIEELYREYGD